jgi:diaminopimelate decarboxylase
MKLIKSLGVKNVDVVSPGEIFKALHCGFKPE